LNNWFSSHPAVRPTLRTERAVCYTSSDNDFAVLLVKGADGTAVAKLISSDGRFADITDNRLAPKLQWTDLVLAPDPLLPADVVVNSSDGRWSTPARESIIRLEHVQQVSTVLPGVQRVDLVDGGLVQWGALIGGSNVLSTSLSLRTVRVDLFSGSAMVRRVDLERQPSQGLDGVLLTRCVAVMPTLVSQCVSVGADPSLGLVYFCKDAKLFVGELAAPGGVISSLVFAERVFESRDTVNNRLVQDRSDGLGRIEIQLSQPLSDEDYTGLQSACVLPREVAGRLFARHPRFLVLSR